MDTITAHMSSRTDDELRRIVTVEARNFREEAVAAAWQELRARGIDAVPPATVAALIELEAHEVPTRWLSFYTWATPISAALVAFAELLELRFAKAATTVAFLLAPSLVLFVGLRRRRMWGYRLNQVFLAWDLVACLLTLVLGRNDIGSGGVSVILVGLWTWANYVYFQRRQHLFV